MKNLLLFLFFLGVSGFQPETLESDYLSFFSGFFENEEIKEFHCTNPSHLKLSNYIQLQETLLKLAFEKSSPEIFSAFANSLEELIRTSRMCGRHWQTSPMESGMLANFLRSVMHILANPNREKRKDFEAVRTRVSQMVKEEKENIQKMVKNKWDKDIGTFLFRVFIEIAEEGMNYPQPGTFNRNDSPGQMGMPNGNNQGPPGIKGRDPGSRREKKRGNGPRRRTDL